jgi:hypothetical protein
MDVRTVTPAALLFARLEDDLNSLGRLVDGLDMAAASMDDEADGAGLRAIISVVDEKVTALKTAMLETREAVERERETR